MCCILVPPKTAIGPILTHENTKTLPQEDLAGPYLENVTENFTCSIKNILPGKDSTSFSFYSGKKLRLRSENGTGKVIQNDEGDGTKYVEWKFSTFFSRSENGGNFSCNVDWKAGQYMETDLSSTMTQYVNIMCKYPILYNRSSVIGSSEYLDRTYDIMSLSITVLQSYHRVSKALRFFITDTQTISNVAEKSNALLYSLFISKSKW